MAYRNFCLFFRFWFILKVGPDHQHIAGCVADDVLGYGADEQPLDGIEASRADHDQIHAVLGRQIFRDDGFRRSVFDDGVDIRYAFIRGIGFVFFHQRFGLADDFVRKAALEPCRSLYRSCIDNMSDDDGCFIPFSHFHCFAEG